MMNQSKRILGALGVLAMMATALPSWAAFTGFSRSTMTATAALTFAGQASVSVDIRNFSDNASTDTIRFTVTSLPQQWVKADQYVLMNSVLTASGGGIQIYTDNTNPSLGNPAYTGTTSAAGLVDTADTVLTLPMAWSVRNTTATAASIAAQDPDQGLPFQGWHYFKDPGTTDNLATPAAENLVNGEEYATVKDGRGIHFGPGPNDVGATQSPDYIVAQANFSSAQTPRTYTGTVRLEAFIE
jgi:hypothetical protein